MKLYISISIQITIAEGIVMLSPQYDLQPLIILLKWNV